MDKQSSYTRTRERLEEIVTQVKAKDMPLEKSLDLYEEALRLGSACAEMIDRTDFSAEELEGIGVSPNDEAADGETGDGFADGPAFTGDDDEDEAVVAGDSAFDDGDEDEADDGAFDTDAADDDGAFDPDAADTDADPALADDKDDDDGFGGND
jgi:exodeoxyribonuclease VII small subunit